MKSYDKFKVNLGKT